MDLAHGRGGTALHFAAMKGHVHLLEWLLKHGAHKSLHVRSKVGLTPLEVANVFGPFPQAEKQLWERPCWTGVCTRALSSIEAAS
jgi:hypothetical protein